MTGRRESGEITYTQRAFEQDAENAMGGDIVRALVELITNADDAYERSGTDGEIAVSVDRRKGKPTTVSVSDSALGLSPEGMKECFSVLGGETSGFEQGEAVRGLFGRGAKDTAAFGRTVFEAVKDGVYSRFELGRSGQWTLDTEPASADHRADLDLPGDAAGLRATIVVESGVDVPGPTMLGTQLQHHVQLRRITQHRTVILRNFSNGKATPAQVVRWEPPDGEVVLDVDVDLDGYPDATAHLTLKRMRTPGDGRVDRYSRHGIEVQGKHATFENTLFGETAPESAWIHGALVCPTIDDLIRSFDETQGGDSTNPSRLLRRDREGLTPDHPFTKALTTAVLRQLAPLLEEMKPKRDAEGGGDQLKQDLQRASRALSALLRTDLQSIDEDEPGGGTTTTATNPLVLIPPRLAIGLGRKRSLTVLANTVTLGPEPTVSVSTSDDAVLEVGELTDWTPHASLPDTVVANVPAHARTLGTCVVTVTSEDASRHATAEIRVVEVIDEPATAPEALEWANSTMSVMVSRERTIRLRAPIELGSGGELLATVALSGEGCSLLDTTARLTLHRDGWLEGTCRIRGVTAETSSRVTASAAGQSAEGTIRVTRPSALDGMGLEVKIIDEPRGNNRGTMRETDTGYLVEVMARHPANGFVLGARREDGTFANEQQPAARLLLAEVVASTICEWLINRESARYPHNFSDAASTLSKRHALITRYLPAAQRTIATEAPDQSA